MIKRKHLSEAGEATQEKPIAKLGGDEKDKKYEKLVAANLIVAAPGRFLADSKLNGLMSEASYDQYKSLGTREGRQSMMSLLAVGVANASLDCLAQAMRLPMEYVGLRDLNLRHGLKGAGLAKDLLVALDDLGAEKPDKVTVGNVNVEAGGQAIVGTVEASGSIKGPHKE
jgi:hypothetical protein